MPRSDSRSWALGAIQALCKAARPSEPRWPRQRPRLSALQDGVASRRDASNTRSVRPGRLGAVGVSTRSNLAKAIGYLLVRWTALTRYRDDGRIGMDNNAAERALRGVGLGRKNYLFMGSGAGGERAAAVYSLVETAKLNGLDPQVYLRDVLKRIADHPINRIDELLPWNVIAAAQERRAA